MFHMKQKYFYILLKNILQNEKYFVKYVSHETNR